MIKNPSRGEAQLNLLFSRKAVAEEFIREVGVRGRTRSQTGRARSVWLSQYLLAKPKHKTKWVALETGNMHPGEMIGMWPDSTMWRSEN